MVSLDPLTLLTCRKDHGPWVLKMWMNCTNIKKLGVYKNYCGSFNATIDETIEKILTIY